MENLENLESHGIYYFNFQAWKAGFSLRIEVAGGYYKITGESGHLEKN